MTTTATARSTSTRRFILRTLATGSILIGIGLATAPAASAVGTPLPPVRMNPDPVVL